MKKLFRYTIFIKLCYHSFGVFSSSIQFFRGVISILLTSSSRSALYVFSTSIRGLRAKHEIEVEKLRSVTCSTDRENEVSEREMYITLR